MARSNDLRTLFIPYQPNNALQPVKGLQDADRGEKSSNWQRHASREYHRRRALEKGVTKGSSSTDRKTRYHLRPDENYALQSQPTTSDMIEDGFLEVFEEIDTSLPVGDVVCNQLDPFNVAIPAGVPKYALNMFHHSYNTVWDIANFGTGRNGNIMHTVLLSSMTSPATFYSNVFAATAHLAWLRASKTSVSQQDKRIQIQVKGLALSHMRREIASIRGHVSDELIFAMLIMAAYSKGDTIDYSQSETRSVGPRAFSYDGGYYGTVDFEIAHISSLVTLLQARGGLHTIKLPGLKEVIILADILCASKWICAPSLPLFRPIHETMSELPRYSHSTGNSLKHLPNGFRQLPLVLASHPIVEIVGHMRITILSYEDYAARSVNAPRLDSLRFAAMTCTHNLHSLNADLHATRNMSEYSPLTTDGDLSSPDTENSDMDVLETALYGALRYACIAFANQFLWPLPRSSGIQLKLSLLLDHYLEDLRSVGGWAKYPELTLWIALMGSLVGLGQMRSDFIHVSRTCLDLITSSANECHRDRSAYVRVGDEIKSESEAESRTGSATDLLMLWERLLHTCRSFLLYEGMESSLGVNLSQVKDEALTTWGSTG